MSSVLTRRRTLLGSVAVALTPGLGTLLLPGDASACHDYKGKSGTGCAARRADQSAGGTNSGSTNNTSAQQSSAPSSNSAQQPRVSGRTIRVNNGPQFIQAMRDALPGNRIQLANGNYSGSFSIGKSGTNRNPILIEASSRLGPVMRSNLTVNGNNVIVSGLRFEGTQLTVRGTDCRITRCHFRNGSSPISAEGARNIEIDRNVIERWRGRGINVNPTISGTIGSNPHIHRNHLHSCTDGRMPGIALGQQFRHSRINLNARVEFNLLERIDKSQTIQCKSSGNTIQYNTLINCGGIINRHGRNNKYIGNWMENCLSLTINDDNSEVRGNKLVNCRLGIEVMGGDVAPNQMPVGSGYPYASGCRLHRNDSHRTRIGVVYSSFKRRLPALNTTISDHRGPLIYENHRNSRVTSQNASRAGGEARKLGRSNVGVNA